LATFTVWAKQLTTGTFSLNLCALVPVTLIDVSADVIPSALPSCKVWIVKCPDVSLPAGGDVNTVDLLWEAQAVYDIIPREPKYDINNNGAYNTVDILIVAQLALLGPELHCPRP
jgi:hypothetical protein